MNVYVKSVAESGVSAMDLLEAELKKKRTCNNLTTNQTILRISPPTAFLSEAWLEPGAGDEPRTYGFLNKSSNALRASLGRIEVNPLDAGAGETLTAVGAVSFSIVVRNE